MQDYIGYLDQHINEITSLIPDRHDFSEGEIGNHIGDGGSDMYNCFVKLYKKGSMEETSCLQTLNLK